MKFRYEQLEVGDIILQFIDEVYLLTEKFPAHERFGLTSQTRRAATSVYLNLAEGTARKSKPDFSRFLTMSLGSLVETDACLKIALRRKYIMQEEVVPVRNMTELIWIKLCALRDSQSM